MLAERANSKIGKSNYFVYTRATKANETTDRSFLPLNPKGKQRLKKAHCCFCFPNSARISDKYYQQRARAKYIDRVTHIKHKKEGIKIIFKFKFHARFAYREKRIPCRGRAFHSRIAYVCPKASDKEIQAFFKRCTRGAMCRRGEFDTAKSPSANAASASP